MEVLNKTTVPKDAQTQGAALQWFRLNTLSIKKVSSQTQNQFSCHQPKPQPL
jgi:hypothetical protein